MPCRCPACQDVVVDNPQLRAADASAAQLLMDWVRSAADGEQLQQGAGPPTPQNYCAMYERMDEQAARRAYQQVRIRRRNGCAHHVCSVTNAPCHASKTLSHLSH